MARWSIPFDQIARNTEADLKQVIQGGTLELITRIIKRSPVKTGRFKHNWNTSINNPDESTTENVDPTGAEAISRAKTILGTYNLGDTIWFMNALPYAVRLEYGWSQQAPQGMTRISAMEFNSEMEQLAKATAR